MTVRNCCFAEINELLRAENAMIREDGQETDQANHELGWICGSRGSWRIMEEGVSVIFDEWSLNRTRSGRR